jgi:transposase
MWKQAKVNIDHHVAVEANYYSVPYQLIRAEVDIRLTAHTVEIFRKGLRVASHARGTGRGHYQIDPAHRPRAHQRYLDWAPSRLIRWATTVGPHTAALVEAILQCLLVECNLASWSLLAVDRAVHPKSCT